MAAAAARHLLNPLATEEQIQRTPSRQDGISEELESDLRACASNRARVQDLLRTPD
jgi:hypothetical protein